MRHSGSAAAEGPGKVLLATLGTMRSAFIRNGAPDYGSRRDALERLEGGILDRKENWISAIAGDYGGRAAEETLLLEIFPVIGELRHALRHLRGWMKPRRVSTGWQFLPGSGRVLYQPLGVVGIIGAWNYPLHLCLSPLVGALAAGNRVMIKPSEMAPRTAACLQAMVSEVFPPDQVAVVTGDAGVSAVFASLPFDHLLFTGSTRVGKLVMKAASEHLTPVTLELGGKCPVLIHRDFPITLAAQRIVAGKLYNAGQTCLAPDYVLLHREKLDEFLAAAAGHASRLYPRLVENPDYTRILNAGHYQRIRRLVEDATDQGACRQSINPANEACSEVNRVFPPTLLWNVREGMAVLEEEIFGPVLPVLTCDSVAEGVALVNSRPRPLALYYFDPDRSRAHQVLQKTVSGGATVNDVLFHIAQSGLPFGGVGQSGMGQYHGFDGFETFSNKKGVFFQSRLAPTALLRPPYGERSRRLIRFLLGKRG